MVALVACGAFGLSREPGCNGTDTPSSGPNAPCTRDKDCSGTLLCSQGVCTDPDASSKPPDGGSDAADASGDGS